VAECEFAMYGKRFKLFELFGFNVYVDLGWLIFVALVIAGIWWFLLGLFLRQAARMSYQKLMMRRAMQALGRKNRSRLSRLIVVDHQNRLAGELALKDLLNFLSLKVELEGV
jgi:hypothetical protein